MIRARGLSCKVKLPRLRVWDIERGFGVRGPDFRRLDVKKLPRFLGFKVLEVMRDSVYIHPANISK